MPRVHYARIARAGARTDSRTPRPQRPGCAEGGALSTWAGRGAGPALDAPQGHGSRGSGGAVAAAAGEGCGVSASPAGPRWWPGGRDKEEEEEEVSRLRAGEPRGPAGEAGSAAPPLSGARLAGPRGAEFPEERRRRRRRWRWEPGRGMGGGAEGRAGGALPGRKRCASRAAVDPARRAGHTLRCCTLAIFSFRFLGFCTSCVPTFPGPRRRRSCAAGEGRVGRVTLARRERWPGSRR